MLIGAFVAVLGYVLQIYPGLSQSVPLRFPSLGGIVRVSDKSELLDIPRSAAGFLALEPGPGVLLHSWERMVGYVLLLAGIAIQVMLLVAAHRRRVARQTSKEARAKGRQQTAQLRLSSAAGPSSTDG